MSVWKLFRATSEDTRTLTGVVMQEPKSMLNPNNIDHFKLYMEAHQAAWDYEENTGKTLTKLALQQFVSTYIEENLTK